MSNYKKINIAGHRPVLDPNYRYTMPAIYGEIKGKTTILPNLNQVAQALHRDPGEILRFLGCELGTQTKPAGSAGSAGSKGRTTASISGRHSNVTLQKLIFQYIEIFVLCPQCGLPETDYAISASNTIWHQCDACGARERIVQDHKVCKYIVAQHNKKDANGRGKNSRGKNQNKNERKDHGRKEGRLSSNKVGNQLRQKVTCGKQKDSFEEEEDDDLDFAIGQTKKYLANNPNASPEDIVEKVTNLQIASGLKAHDKISVLVRAVIESPQSFIKKKLIEKYGPVLEAIVNGNKMMERHLIASLELICIQNQPYFAVLLQQCYEADIIAEETFFDWAEDSWDDYSLVENETTRAAIRQMAEPFVVWLKEAESEDDSDDSDDDNSD